MTQTGTFRQPTKKELILQDLQILLWGLLTLVLAVLMILEMIPTISVGALEIGEPIKVSSSLISVSEKNYVSAISGSIFNSSDDPVRIEGVTVVVGDGKTEKTIEMDGFLLPPRTEEELSAGWTGDIQFDRILSVTATVNGEACALSNADATGGTGGVAIFYLVLLLPVVWMLVRASKIRYYLYQETKLAEMEA